MSKLKELIDKLCPDGVEYKKLGEVCHINIGEFVHKNKQSNNGKYPVFNGGRQNTGYYDEYNNTANKVIISARGANAGFVNKVYTNFWAGNSCYSLSPIDSQKLNWEYLFYSLKNLETELLNNQQTGSIPALSKRQIEEFYIHLPPIEVQEEIVRILDNFTKCTAELQAELQAREEQYEYYRNKLLSFEGRTDVEYKKLGDLGVFESIGVDKKTIEGQPLVTLLNYVDVYKNTYIDNSIPKMIVSASTKKVNACTCEKGDIFITPTSETKNDIGHASVITETLINTVYSYHIMRFRLIEFNMTTSFFIRYLFESNFIQKQIYRLAKGLTRFGLSKYDFAKIEIPLPPIEVQEEIVRILDKFETLVNDLSQGLPAELEARQNQYEYYRNKLLTFDKILSA
jgi:type I restriction enzyme S subunit